MRSTNAQIADAPAKKISVAKIAPQMNGVWAGRPLAAGSGTSIGRTSESKDLIPRAGIQNRNGLMNTMTMINPNTAPSNPQRAIAVDGSTSNSNAPVNASAAILMPYQRPGLLVSPSIVVPTP